MRPRWHPAAGNLNEAIPGELDQKLDMLAPDDDHAPGLFAADELNDLINKVRCSLATADMPNIQIRVPGPCEPASLLTTKK
jgi:hypothetical protein